MQGSARWSVWRLGVTWENVQQTMNLLRVVEVSDHRPYDTGQLLRFLINSRYSKLKVKERSSVTKTRDVSSRSPQQRHLNLFVAGINIYRGNRSHLLKPHLSYHDVSRRKKGIKLPTKRVCRLNKAYPIKCTLHINAGEILQRNAFVIGGVCKERAGKQHTKASTILKSNKCENMVMLVPLKWNQRLIFRSGCERANKQTDFHGFPDLILHNQEA